MFKEEEGFKREMLLKFMLEMVVKYYSLSITKISSSQWLSTNQLPLCVDDPKQNAGTIHASNPEHLPVFKAPRRDNLERNGGTIHATNPEHLLLFKALCRDDPEQNAGKIHASDREYLELNVGMIHWEHLLKGWVG